VDECKPGPGARCPAGSPPGPCRAAAGSCHGHRSSESGTPVKPNSVDSGVYQFTVECPAFHFYHRVAALPQRLARAISSPPRRKCRRTRTGHRQRSSRKKRKAEERGLLRRRGRGRGWGSRDGGGSDAAAAAVARKAGAAEREPISGSRRSGRDAAQCASVFLSFVCSLVATRRARANRVAFATPEVQGHSGAPSGLLGHPCG
jgi:hypothetical protein